MTSKQIKEQLDIKKKTEEERIKKFEQELTALLEKHNIAFGATPFITSDGRISANLRIYDADEVKKAQEKSNGLEAA